MFYEQVLLSHKGAFANLWIAAHWDKNLKKFQMDQIIDTDIVEAADKITSHKGQLALRLRGHLLLGLCRIYYKKVDFLYSDCNNVLVKIKMAFRPATNIDLDESVAAENLITLPNEDLETFELELPDIHFDIDELPDSDDNLLSLHTLRSKVLIGGPSRFMMDESVLQTPEMTREQTFDFGRSDTLDLLEPKPTDAEDDLANEIWRGVAAEAASGRPSLTAGFDFGNMNTDTADYEYDAGYAPDINPDDMAHHRASLLGEKEASVELPEFSLDKSQMELPAPTRRVRRTHSQFVDETTQLEHEFLKQRIMNPHFFTKEEFLLAPTSERQIKRRKLDAMDGQDYLIEPFLKGISKPLRGLMRSMMKADQVALQPESKVVPEEEPSIEGFRNEAEPQEPLDYVPNKQFEPAMWADDDDGYGYQPDIEQPTVHEEERRTSLEPDLELPDQETSVGSKTSKKAPIDTSLGVSLDASTESNEQMSVRTTGLFNLLKQEAGVGLPMSFDRRFQNKTKSHVARAFLALLEMKSKGYIELNQDEPYADIQVVFKDKTPPQAERVSVV